MINISLPDGAVRQYEAGTTGMQIAESISAGLARMALAIAVNGETWDLSRPIHQDAAIAIYTWKDEEGQKTYWHSSAHLMAEALEALYPGTKFGIGPAIDKGFYYDIDTGDKKLNPEDLAAIEQKMMELAKRDVAYKRSEVSKKDAINYFTDKDDAYKLELIAELEDGSITFYQQGDFIDLCKGPHIPSTGQIKSVKLLNIAGAYWRGKQDRPQMTRIYGITFPKKAELDDYLDKLEQAKLRDHRKLGKELELFTFSNKVGPGLPLWLPKGTVLRNTLSRFLETEQTKRGYSQVVTPHIGNLELYRTSGHYPYYKESQFPAMIEEVVDDVEQGFLLKPMNCPHHTQIYAHSPKSYRDLPVRLAEFGTVYRYEQSGELGGLTRVRGFTQDDAHIFCTPEQVKDEFKNVIDLILTVLKALNFTEYTAQVSLRDPSNTDKYVGSDDLWASAEQAIRESAAEMGLITIEEEGEAAFYGPKLDFMVKDALGRSWQLGTVQVDYNLPERFDLWYTGEDNEKHRPVMIHRAPFGSLERFIGVLIEHCAGKFPVWLCPQQVNILSITQDVQEYAKKLEQNLQNVGIRAEADIRSEKIGAKIRHAELQKVPYMLIVGRNEAEQETVSVRRQGQGDQGTVPFSTFLAQILAENNPLG